MIMTNMQLCYHISIFYVYLFISHWHLLHVWVYLCSYISVYAYVGESVYLCVYVNNVCREFVLVVCLLMNNFVCVCVCLCCWRFGLVVCMWPACVRLCVYMFLYVRIYLSKCVCELHIANNECIPTHITYINRTCISLWKQLLHNTAVSTTRTPHSPTSHSTARPTTRRRVFWN